MENEKRIGNRRDDPLRHHDRYSSGMARLGWVEMPAFRITIDTTFRDIRVHARRNVETIWDLSLEHCDATVGNCLLDNISIEDIEKFAQKWADAYNRVCAGHIGEWRTK